MRAFACLFVLHALLIVSVSAKIESLKVDRDGRQVFHIESFGYETGGVFWYSCKVWYDSSLDDPEVFPMAFVLQRSSYDEGIRVEQAAQHDDKCFHDDRQDRIVRDVTKAEWDSMSWTESISVPGYYHLYFSNCDKHALVSFSMDLVQYNLGDDGKTRDYLSAGETSLPTCFFLFFVAFGIALIVWVQHLVRNREDIRNFHYLMTVVIMLKVLAALFKSLEYHYIKTTGTSHHWNVIYYVFSCLNGMMMFAVIALIGIGLKPYLTEPKQMKLAVIVVQAIVHVSAVSLNDTAFGSTDSLTWPDMLYLLDMICCCFILWWIRRLEESVDVEGTAACVVLRLKRLCKFYVLLVCYICFTRIIIFLRGHILTYEWIWLAVVFRQTAALISYCYTGWLFRPQTNNSHLQEIPQDGETPEGPTLTGHTACTKESAKIGVSS